MKFENIMKILGTKRRGQFVRIQSISDLEKDVRAAYKLLWRVEKESVGTYKFGCKLANCKRWQEKEAARTEPKREYTDLTQARLILLMTSKREANTMLSNFYALWQLTAERNCIILVNRKCSNNNGVRNR